jgi:radical SAM superfamily enzyme YgiQ (UPF0313 family)
MEKPLVILAYPKINHEKNYVYFWMPFSILAIAKVLIDEDIADVVLFDGNQQGLIAWQELLDSYADQAAFIGLSIMTGGGQIGHALEMAKIAKERNHCPLLVFGGPHVNVLPDQTLEHPLVDAVLQGVGQTSVPALVRALTGDYHLDNVPGLSMKVDNQRLQGPPNSPRSLQLGGYPWHLLDVQKYVRDDPTIAPRTLNYVSSQGCIYKCQFCYELTYQRKYSKMSAELMLNDIEDLKSRYNISGIKFYDADWFVDLNRAAAFSKGLLERDLKIAWAASINPNDILRARRVQPQLMKNLAKSQCTRLLMGVESGSDRVLEEIVKKEVNRTQILDVAQEIADQGMLGSYTFIIGFPGETQQEQEETFSLIEELWSLDPIPETRVHLFAPYPGTPLFEAAVEQGFKAPAHLEGWSSYDYYDSQTPWTTSEMVKAASAFTKMRLSPSKII